MSFSEQEDVYEDHGMEIKKSIERYLKFLLMGLGGILIISGCIRFGTAYLGVSAVFIFFIVLPGIILQSIFLKTDNSIDKAAFSFTLGIAWNALIFGLLSLIGVSYDVLGIRLLPAILIIILIILTRGGPAWPPSKKPRTPQPFSSSDLMVIFLCFLFMFCLLFTESVTILGSDGLTHIFRIRDVVQSNTFGHIESIPRELPLRIRLWRNPIQPYFLLLTGTNAIEQYLILSSLAAPFILCSFDCFTRGISKNSTFRVTSMVLFVTHFGGFVSNLSHSNYSWYICWSLLFVSTAVLLRRISGDGSRGAAIGIILGCTTIVYHFNYFLIFIVGGIALTLSWFFWGSGASRKVRIYGAIAVGVLLVTPVAILVFGSLWTNLMGSELSGHTGKELNIRMTRLPWGGVVADYKQTYMRWSGFLGTAALVISPFLWPVRGKTKESIPRGYLLLGMILPMLIAFNPVFMTFAYAVFAGAGLYMYRLLFFCPYLSVTAFVLSIRGEEHGWRRIAEMNPFRKAFAVCVIFCVVPVFSYHALHYLPTSFAYSIQNTVARIIPWQRVPYRYDHSALSDAMNYIRQNIDSRGKFVSDPFTSWMIQAATENKVLDSAKKPEDVVVMKSYQVISPQVDIWATIELLRKHEISHVLINTTFNNQMLIDYFSFAADSKRNGYLVRKFLQYPEFFEKLYEKKGIFIFRVHII